VPKPNASNEPRRHELDKPLLSQRPPAESILRCLAIGVIFSLGSFDSVALAQADLSNLATAVERGRESLEGSPKIPWYDPERDDFRPARIPLPRAPRPASTSHGLADWTRLLGWLGLAALLGLLVYFVIKAYLLGEVKEAGVLDQEAECQGDSSRVDALPVALTADPSNYLAEARRYHDAGDFAQAIVYLFSQQLFQLDRRHWIRLVKGKTNRQYLQEIGRSSAPSAGELANLFEETLLIFEEIFFGKRLPSREQLNDCWRQVDRFECLVAQVEEHAA